MNVDILTPSVTRAFNMHRPDIQALRALAVALVIAYHAGVPLLEGGFIGVDIFFVVSGYLITASLAREVENTGSIRLLDFYARRARRLVPALALVLSCTAVASALLFSPAEQKDHAWSILSASTYVSNIVFAVARLEYLSGDIHLDPTLHTWSLSVEEQFYLLWPLAIIAAARCGRQTEVRTRLRLAQVLIALVSFIAMMWVAQRAQPFAFFLSPLRAWEFAIGGLIATGRAVPRNLPGSLARLGQIFGLALVVTPAIIYSAQTEFPGVSTVAPVIGTAVLLWMGSHPVIMSQRLQHLRLVRWTGDASYSLYLWHWPVIAMLDSLAPLRAPTYVLVGVVVTTGLSYLSHRFVEEPVRNQPGLRTAPARSLALGAILTFTAAVFALGVGFRARQLGAEEMQQQIASVVGIRHAVYDQGCHLVASEVEPKICAFGDTLASTTIVLYGDSHAAHWSTALANLGLQKGFKLISLTKSGCPSVPVAPLVSEVGRSYVECALWQERSASVIDSIRPRGVVVANSRQHLGEVLDTARAEQWRAALVGLLSRQHSAGRVTVLVDETPWFPIPVPTCLSRAAYRSLPSTSCDAPRSKVLEPGVAEMHREVVKSLPGVVLFDPNSTLCSDSVCFASTDGQPLYSDRHHLIAAASVKLARALASPIDSFFSR